ncbi:MAG: TraR/DksA family transcriptional regulator [Alphaproteobacteria bacterium]|nr:TraR/DksA family transcriptional regulator [Alphaproteobacteria bacterium]
METAKYKTRLLNRREELNTRLQTIEHDLDQKKDPDVEERAVEREGDEVMESLGQSGLLELKAIEAALSRIENGTFGICAQCEEPISEARLDVVPTAPLCRVCAAAA